MGSSRKDPVLNSKQLNALASFQTSLSQVTSLNASAAQQDLQAEIARMQTAIFRQQQDDQAQTLGSLLEKERLQKDTLGNEFKRRILESEKALSDLRRQTDVQTRAILPRQRAQILQLKDIAGEADRQASFINRQLALAKDDVHLREQSIEFQIEQEARNIASTIRVQEIQARQSEIQARQAEIGAQSARTRASQTLLAAELRRSAAESIK